MRNSNKLQEILSTAGYDVKDITNRSRSVKSLNDVFTNSAIKMEICTKGKVWVSASGSKFNVKISLDGTFSVGWKVDITPYSLLSAMGLFLRKEKVRGKISSETSLPCTCPKCEGKGTIPAFAHYANGVCFDCLGIGIIGKLSVKNVQDNNKPLTGRNYIKSFYVSGNYSEQFPSGVNNLKKINWIDHPTATEYLSELNGTYYIHAPNCGRNDWFAIPGLEFEKFKSEYSKVNGKELI
jgi:hypothetical protein